MENLMVGVNKIEMTVTPKSQGNKVQINLVPGGSALIDWIRTDCGCANDPKYDDKLISLVYNDNTDLGSATSKAFSKNVFVFMKDGKPKEVKNPKTGKMTTNWDRKFEKVELRITVKNKSIAR